MEDVFDVLVEDHEEIRQALAELEKGPTAATGATEDQLMLRKIMTEELIIEEAKHEEIELTCVWPAVRGHVPGGDQLADRAICAELEIMALLAELDQLDVLPAGVRAAAQRVHPGGQGAFRLRGAAGVAAAAFGADRQGSGRAGPQDPPGQAGRARPAVPAGVGLVQLRGISADSVNLQPAFSYPSGSWCSLEEPSLTPRPKA